MAAAAFLPLQVPNAHRLPVQRSAVRCCDDEGTPPDGKTKVGSKAYYDGFFSGPLDESVTIERGDGTKQAISLASGAVGVISLLFIGFMASNGLIPWS